MHFWFQMKKKKWDTWNDGIQILTNFFETSFGYMVVCWLWHMAYGKKNQDINMAS